MYSKFCRTNYISLKCMCVSPPRARPARVSSLCAHPATPPRTPCESQRPPRLAMGGKAISMHPCLLCTENTLWGLSNNFTARGYPRQSRSTARSSASLPERPIVRSCGQTIFLRLYTSRCHTSALLNQVVHVPPSHKRLAVRIPKRGLVTILRTHRGGAHRTGRTSAAGPLGKVQRTRGAGSPRQGGEWCRRSPSPRPRL